MIYLLSKQSQSECDLTRHLFLSHVLSYMIFGCEKIKGVTLIDTEYIETFWRKIYWTRSHWNENKSRKNQVICWEAFELWDGIISKEINDEKIRKDVTED